MFRNSDHGVVDSSVANNAVNVVYIETRITIRSRTIDPASGAPATRTLTQEVKDEKPRMMDHENHQFTHVLNAASR